MILKLTTAALQLQAEGFIAEASDLGIPPGTMPTAIELTHTASRLGTTFVETLVLPNAYIAERGQVYVYRAAPRGISVHILLD